MRALLAQIAPVETEPIDIDAADEWSTWLVAIAIFAVGIVAARIAGRALRHVLLRTGVERSLAVLFGRAAAWVLSGVALFYALSNLGVQLGPLIGALGITGLVVALALQGILENVFAGLILQARRPFYLGDEIETSEHRGRVVDITTRVVRIHAFTGEDVFVPNSVVLNNVIVNQTRPGRRRLDLGVSVAYGTDLAEAVRVAEEAVRSVPGVVQQPPPRCWAEEFAESGIELEVLLWHDPPEEVRWRVRSDAIQAIHRAFVDADITIPFPQRTLWFADGSDEGG